MQETPYSDLDDFLNKEAPVNPLDAFLDRELPAKEEDRRRAIPITRGSGIQTGSLITGKDDPATMALKLGKSALSGLESGAADLGRTLDFYSTKLSELTGLPKGGIFGKLANDWDYWGNRLKGEGLQGVAGDIARGTGKAVGDVAQIMALGGGPAGMAIHGAATGGTDGVKGAVTGGLGGALMGGALHGLGYLSRGAQVPAAVATGAITTPGSLEEKAKGGAEMGLLQLAGMRKTPEISPLAGMRAAEAAETSKIGHIEEQPESVKLVLDAIRKAEPIRSKQEQLYAKERSKRFREAIAAGEETAGEQGLYAQLSRLKGELPKAQFEPIRDKVSQDTIDDLFNRIQNSPRLAEMDKIPAKKGLAKLFGELGGGVPQPKELRLLQDVFGQEFTETLASKASTKDRFKQTVLNVVGIPRSIMASGDLSFGFRQGVMMAARHPVIFAKDFAKQFELFGSERAFRQMYDQILSRPTYDLARQSGLAITDLGKTLESREEAFQSQYAEKIPVVGKLVRASSRAYTGFADLLRMDTFDYLVKRAGDLGQNVYENPSLASDLAKVVNVGTGRGNLGKLASSGTALNAFFFSPRLISSRLSVLNPKYYVDLEPMARKEALKTLLAFTGAGMTVMGLAKAAGAGIGTDPRSADFGKIKIGKTRFDVWGGFSQYARLAAQMITGKLVSSTTGKVSVLGEGYRPLNRLEILERMIQSKEAPLFSFATAMLKGQGTFGKKLDVGSEIAERMIPMVIQDAKDIWDSDKTLFPASALGVFGVGMQTYKDAKPSDALLNHPSMTKFYEAKVAIESKNKEFNDAVKAGDIPRATAIRDKSPRITMAPAFNAIERSIAAYRKAIDQVAVNKDISKAEQDRRMKDLANKLLDFVEARKDLWGKN